MEEPAFLRRGIGIVRPIGLRPQLRRTVQLVIGDHEFRPWQGDDDVVALHFDVEVVVVRDLAETSSSSVREPLYEPGGTGQLGLGFLNCSTLTGLSQLRVVDGLTGFSNISFPCFSIRAFALRR